MKLSASTQNSFPFTSPVSFGDGLGRGTARRHPFQIRPFIMEEILPNLAANDTLAQKQETICAFILGLCLFASVAISFTQLAPA